jgi:hypothetical protein
MKFEEESCAFGQGYRLAILNAVLPASGGQAEISLLTMRVTLLLIF